MKNLNSFLLNFGADALPIMMKTPFRLLLFYSLWSIVTFTLQGSNLSNPLLTSQNKWNYASTQVDGASDNFFMIDDTINLLEGDQEITIDAFAKRHPQIGDQWEDTHALFVRCQLPPQGKILWQKKILNLEQILKPFREAGQLTIFESLRKPKTLYFAKDIIFETAVVKKFTHWIKTWIPQAINAKVQKCAQNKIIPSFLHTQKIHFSTPQLVPLLRCLKTKRPFYHGYAILVPYQEKSGKKQKGELHLFSFAKYFVFSAHSTHCANPIESIGFFPPWGTSKKEKSIKAYKILDHIPFLALSYYQKLREEEKKSRLLGDLTKLILNHIVDREKTKKTIQNGAPSLVRWSLFEKINTHFDAIQFTTSLTHPSDNPTLFKRRVTNIQHSPLALETLEAFYMPEWMLVLGFIRKYAPRHNSSFLYTLFSFHFSYESFLKINISPKYYKHELRNATLSLSVIQILQQNLDIPHTPELHSLLLKLSYTPFLDHDEIFRIKEYANMLYYFKKVVGGSAQALLQKLQQKHPQLALLQAINGYYHQNYLLEEKFTKT